MKHFGLLINAVASACVLLLSACSPSNTSHSVAFSVSLDGGTPVASGFSWVCSYSQGFSERNMAIYVEAKSVPDEAAVNYIKFADGRMALVRPSRWPQYSAENRCTLPQEDGWEGFVIDAGKPVPTLTRFDHGAEKRDAPRIRISDIRADSKLSASTKQNEDEVKKLVSKVSLIVAYYFELPLFDDIPSVQLSPNVVNFLKTLPKNRPTLLKVAQPVNTARKPGRNEGVTQIIELPDFQLASAHPQDSVVLQMRTPGEPIPIPKQPNQDKNAASIFMLGVLSPPKILFPLVKETVSLEPMAAVWYPSSKQLIVVDWSDRSNEIQALLK